MAFLYGKQKSGRTGRGEFRLLLQYCSLCAGNLPAAGSRYPCRAIRDFQDCGSDKCRLSCRLAMHHRITVSHTEDPSVREECPRPDSADAHEPAGVGLPGTGRPGHCSVSLSHRLYALPKRPAAGDNVTFPGRNSLCSSPVDQYVQDRLPPLLSFPAADSF